MRKAEIVIIGGGVVGASVAFHLAERGAKDIVILESEERQGLGSTGAATGGIRSQFETDINIRMSLYSLDFFRGWDVDCEYDPKGYLFFATTDEQFEYLKRNVEKLRGMGVPGVETVGPGSIAEIVPGMNCEDIKGGSFGKHDGFINPLAVMRGFTEGARARGAKVEFATRALSIEAVAGKVATVETDKGRFACGVAVICTGARARELAATAGVELPVEPQRRQIVWAKTARPLPAELPMVIDIGTGFHFRPARDFTHVLNGGTRAGGNGESDEVLFAYPDPDEPASVNTAFDDVFIGKVYSHAERRAPFLFGSTVIRERCRAGLYENTPDHHAILGGCDVEGLYLANGFSGHGVMHSPATGRALSEIITDGKASFLDVSCLSLGRFAAGELLYETAFI